MNFENSSSDCQPEISSRKGVSVILGHKHMAGIDKLISLLHSWWLMRGGSSTRFQDLCRKVTNMPTDGGPENQAALARNILPAFCGAGFAVGNE
eukprot:1013628-Karenia_brevis.AAC.1